MITAQQIVKHVTKKMTDHGLQKNDKDCTEAMMNFNIYRSNENVFI